MQLSSTFTFKATGLYDNVLIRSPKLDILATELCVIWNLGDFINKNAKNLQLIHFHLEKFIPM